MLAKDIDPQEHRDQKNRTSEIAHTGKNEVRNAYNRAIYVERRKPVMKWWSEHIEKAASGNLSLTGNKGLKLVSI